MGQKIEKNLENSKPAEGNAQENADSGKAKETKTKFKVCFRLPFYKEAIPQKTEEELEAEKTEKANKKQRRKERIGDFVKGASTVAVIAGAGLVAFGKRKKKRDEEKERQTVDASHDDDDSEANRTVYLPPDDSDAETEENKKKHEEETE